MGVITVKLYGGLIPLAPSAPGCGEIQIEVSSGEDVRRVLERLGVPGTSVHLAFVGKERVKMDYCLKEGDILNLFPAMAGG